MQKIQTLFMKWKENGFLLVVYTLLAEALVLGFFGFAGLFTLETLLPSFVTTRLSLTKFLFLLLSFTFALGLLGRYIDLSFHRPTKKSPLIWMGLVWTLGILAISLYKFPLIIIPVLIAGFFIVGFLFWKIFTLP